MLNNKITKFSGMLNQHEFKERYVFIVQRRANGFSREDIAFLLGRAPYHIIDYEELSDQIRMDYEDHEILVELFNTCISLVPSFDTKIDGQNISREKRMVRGHYIEFKNKSYYKFIHPWTIKGVNEPIMIKVNKHRNSDNDEEIRHLLTYQLNNLIKLGYFTYKSSPMMIYRYIYANMWSDCSLLFLPQLKLVMYEFIFSNKLTTKNEGGHINYQIKL